MPRFTLQTGKIFRLSDLLRTGTATDGTAATAATRVLASHPTLCSGLSLQNVTGSAGTLYVARGNSAVSATDYDLAIEIGQSDREVFHIRGNTVDLEEWYVFAGANATIIAVLTIPY